MSYGAPAFLLLYLPLFTKVPGSMGFSEVGYARCPSEVGLTPGCRMVTKCGRRGSSPRRCRPPSGPPSRCRRRSRSTPPTDELHHRPKRRWRSSPAPLLGASVGRFLCTSRGLPSPPARTSARASLREAASWRELCAHFRASFSSPDRQSQGSTRR